MKYPYSKGRTDMHDREAACRQNTSEIVRKRLWIPHVTIKEQIIYI